MSIQKIDASRISNNTGHIAASVMTTLIPTINALIEDQERIRREFSEALRPVKARLAGNTASASAEAEASEELSEPAPTPIKRRRSKNSKA